MTNSNVDDGAFTPERMGAATRRLVELLARHIRPGEKTLAYILSQSNRIGHFALETQILKSLYEDDYDRILVVTDQMSLAGTNHWIRSCGGRKFHFIETEDFDVILLGQVDGGLQSIGPLDTLFRRPSSIILDFWRSILAGGEVRSLTLPAIVEDIAREALSARGIDPDEPFVLFHNRTLAYRPSMTYHSYRTAEVSTYREALAHLMDSGYRVIRVGEPGMDTMGFEGTAYVNVPDWDGVDPAVDLFVLARCAFGLAQNSGPIWAAAAFGRPVLWTNAPFEHLNFPYLDDITLFKHYRRAGSDVWLTYKEILDDDLPSLFRSEDFAERGVELVSNAPEALLSATQEMLARVSGNWSRDDAQNARFQSLGAEFERRVEQDPTFQRNSLNFYGYAHGFGSMSRAQVDAQPTFLD